MDELIEAHATLQPLAWRLANAIEMLWHVAEEFVAGTTTKVSGNDKARHLKRSLTHLWRVEGELRALFPSSADAFAILLVSRLTTAIKLVDQVLTPFAAGDAQSLSGSNNRNRLAAAIAELRALDELLLPHLPDSAK
jgi:hypothetical protein